MPEPAPKKPSIRYRVTLAAICAVLGFLGGDDLWVALHNRAPHLLRQTLAPAPGQHWLRLEGAHLDLAGAINTTGTVEVEGLLVPLRLEPQGPIQVLVETRDPSRIELFKRFHFEPDTEQEKAAFLAANRDALSPRVTVEGLRMRGLVARSNLKKLWQMAQEGGLDLAPEALILVEGERPSPWRGMFFFLIALAGLMKVWTLGRKAKEPIQE